MKLKPLSGIIIVMVSFVFKLKKKKKAKWDHEGFRGFLFLFFPHGLLLAHGSWTLFPKETTIKTFNAFRICLV